MSIVLLFAFAFSLRHSLSAIHFRSHASAVQKSFSTIRLQKNRRRYFVVAERTESGLHDHVSNALHFATVHAPLRYAPIGLQ